MSIKSRLWFRFWAHPIGFSFSFRISPLSRRGVLICSICATWAGVQSFAGFVAASDRMLLLWTTQYFTRLWCALAPWSRKQWLGHTHIYIHIYYTHIYYGVYRVALEIALENTAITCIYYIFYIYIGNIF